MSGTIVSTDLELYVYDEWNVVLIFLEASNKPVRRKYTWGLDLSGLSGAGVGPASSRSTDGMHNAGGIGGLLATVETKRTSSTSDDDNYWHFYDGNGNVGQLLEYDATGDTVSTTPAAHYEYDPYGQVLRTTGAYADANPFRFSTKWFEHDFGIGCWPYRWYWLRDGRWGSRDPIEESGGLNLYQYARSRPTDLLDPLGADAGGPGGTCYGYVFFNGQQYLVQVPCPKPPKPGICCNNCSCPLTIVPEHGGRSGTYMEQLPVGQCRECDALGDGSPCPPGQVYKIRGGCTLAAYLDASGACVIDVDCDFGGSSLGQWWGGGCVPESGFGILPGPPTP